MYNSAIRQTSLVQWRADAVSSRVPRPSLSRTVHLVDALHKCRLSTRQAAVQAACTTTGTQEIAPDPCGMPTRNAAPLYNVSVGQLVRATIVFVARLFMRQLVVGITIITIPTPNVFKMDWQGSCRLYFAEARAN